MPKPPVTPASDGRTVTPASRASVLPTDYRINAERALAYDPVGASNYLKHTLIGDPELDALMEDMSSLPGRELARYIRAGMEEDEEMLRAAPGSAAPSSSSRRLPIRPGSTARPSARAIRAFHRDSGMILAGFVTGVLVDGFTTYIAKSFVLTGRIFDRGVRRLQQNNRHFVEIFFPGGLDRQGDGWKLSVRDPDHSRPDEAFAAPPPRIGTRRPGAPLSALRTQATPPPASPRGP